MKELLNKAFFNKNKASLSKEVLLELQGKRLPVNPSSKQVCEIKNI